jgi:hypothetical protein
MFVLLVEDNWAPEGPFLVKNRLAKMPEMWLKLLFRLKARQCQ